MFDASFDLPAITGNQASLQLRLADERRREAGKIMPPVAEMFAIPDSFPIASLASLQMAVADEEDDDVYDK
jgi:hypothetical protein